MGCLTCPYPLSGVFIHGLGDWTQSLGHWVISLALQFYRDRVSLCSSNWLLHSCDWLQTCHFPAFCLPLPCWGYRHAPPLECTFGFYMGFVVCSGLYAGKDQHFEAWTQASHAFAVSGRWPAVSRYLWEQILIFELQPGKHEDLSSTPQNPWWHKLVILTLGRRRPEIPLRSVASQHVLFGELQASEPSHHKNMVSSTQGLAAEVTLWPPSLHMQRLTDVQTHRYKQTHRVTKIHRCTHTETQRYTQTHR